MRLLVALCLLTLAFAGCAEDGPDATEPSETRGAGRPIGGGSANNDAPEEPGEWSQYNMSFTESLTIAGAGSNNISLFLNNDACRTYSTDGAWQPLGTNLTASWQDDTGIVTSIEMRATIFGNDYIATGPSPLHVQIPAQDAGDGDLRLVVAFNDGAAVEQSISVTFDGSYLASEALRGDRC